MLTSHLSLLSPTRLTRLLSHDAAHFAALLSPRTSIVPDEFAARESALTDVSTSTPTLESLQTYNRGFVNEERKEQLRCEKALRSFPAYLEAVGERVIRRRARRESDTQAIRVLAPVCF
ncbi:hypothetical protein ST47_g9141 [Ascochyta rabiei]|uniref:Uncharacterized protein n=1 Tax=Didymella rabiei TaxID=5454 RepID=A0A162XJK5_DIDRA|nr:hypothetical protein ST47_g9141 [Ascochyta rabiei]